MLKTSPWSVAAVLLSALLGLWYTVPNFLPDRIQNDWKAFLPSPRLNLGLDLQGGSYLLLQVDMASVERDQLQDMLSSARQILKEGGQPTAVQQRGDGLLLEIPNSQQDAVKELLRRKMPYNIDITGSDTSLTIKPSALQIEEGRKAALERSLDIIRLRIDETGTKEPLIIRQGTERILVQMPGLDDPARIRNILGKTAKLTMHLVNPEVGFVNDPRQRVPGNTMLLPMKDRDVTGGDTETYVGIFRQAMVSGDTLTDAQASFSEGQPVVSFRFNAVGAKKFGQATTRNVGQLFAIVLDGEVISAPRINEPIQGGSGIISGNFTTESANDMALVLRSGALPAPLTIIEERTVGAGMGADAVAMGERASLVAVVLVIIVTAAMYGLFGLYAVAALLLNLVLMLALMTVLQATLTLPGIAGIVLTIGMAVDANVLIFERIREEVRAGRTAVAAVDNGYRMAIGTIMDSNITTLLAGIILYAFGTGTIRGFAVTLVLGIFTSLFSAIMVTRILVSRWLRSHRNQAVPL